MTETITQKLLRLVKILSPTPTPEGFNTERHSLIFEQQLTKMES